MSRSLRDLLENENSFIFTFELVPGRSVRTRHYQEILRFLEESPKYNLFQAFSITDNAGGHPALSPIPLGRTIKDLGLEVIIHFSCKDKNRNQLESELLALDREGLHNLLVLTGDYPFYGYGGRAKPVFDLDSVQLLQMITQMEKGFELPKEAPGGGVTLPAIPFYKGAVVNPFKWSLSELWWQYIKLYKKLLAGAYFIITQVGFYPKKWYELKELFQVGITRILSQFLEEPSFYQRDFDQRAQQIPLIGSILFLTPPLIRALSKGKIPGIYITESLVELYRQRSNWEDLSLEICAKLAVILKGLGYRGVHLCSFPLDYEKLLIFLEKFYHYEKNWEHYLGEFNDDTIYLENTNGIIRGRMPCILMDTFSLEYKGKRNLFYYLNEVIHRLFFEKKTRRFFLFQRIAKAISKSKRILRFFTNVEYGIKKLLFDCQKCGDCSLWEFNYSCPQSQCAKYLLNGPCGGSIFGYCEVYPFEKRCHFVTAFERVKEKKELKKFFRPVRGDILPPRNWSLYRTSSWINFYLLKDHRGHED